jgi:hypothetical protein
MGYAYHNNPAHRQAAGRALSSRLCEKQGAGLRADKGRRLPCADTESLALYYEFETAVYRQIR